MFILLIFPSGYNPRITV